MPVQVVIGAQWGDEGKGKIIDVLSEKMDMVIRYQGGANAGHTIYIGDDKYVMHLIPSGILREKTICIVGAGVVLDPKAFCDELDFLKQSNINFEGRLFISPRTHIIMPYHKRLDSANELDKGQKQIGTTGRGIGPAYADKYARIGIRAVDLFHEDILVSKIKENLVFKNFILEKYYHSESESAEEIIEFVLKYGKIIRPFIKETIELIRDFQLKNKNILLEGAQGALLDIDYGSYPYVTSSHPVSGGAFIGSGVGPVQGQITGVMKSYLTRVGNGPFPTELKDQHGETLRRNGNEFGATTGRPRRCGWLDLNAAKFSSYINGLNSLALTKMDVLTGFKEIKVCISYKFNKKIIDWFPADNETLDNVEPVYDTLPGWQEPIDDCRSLDDLPENARKYIQYIEDYLKIPVKYISTGYRRDQIIQI